MLDINFIREHADLVKDGVAKKHKDVDIDRLLELDEKRRDLRAQIDEKRAEQNKVGEQIARVQGEERTHLIESMKHLKEGLHALEGEYDTIIEEWTKLMLSVPNMPSPDTPVGDDEDDNVVVRSWGERPNFTFTPKHHDELGKTHELIDTEKAGEISGARFAYIKNELAQMQLGLMQEAFKVLTSRDTLAQIAEEAKLDINPSPFIPIIPPVFMRSETMGKMARLHPIDDRFYFEKDDLVLIGSAEHTLGPLHMDEILDEDALPIRYVGYSTSFRREAGSYGKDTKGIIRLHQFDKVEMETFVRPEEGFKEQQFLVAIQEHLMQKLKLPYQVVAVCTGDMGGPDQRQFDIETWMPGEDAYRETHSADYMGGFQSRRLNTRIRLTDGGTTHVHMNDATGFAMGRTLAAIIENYQQEDGTIRVPDILVPYVGKDVIGTHE